jgi:hypothetical protein
MPSTGQRGARSRLEDVLADIKNSRSEDDVNNSRPTPAKRRSTVNYVALSGHTPRQGRSSTTTTTSSSTTTTTNPLIGSKVANNNSPPNRTKTYVLKFVDNTVDLSQFLHPNKNETKEQPLYPIVRAWAQVQSPTIESDPDPVQEQNKADGQEKLTRKHHRRKERGSVDTICSNLLNYRTR